MYMNTQYDKHCKLVTRFINEKLGLNIDGLDDSKFDLTFDRNKNTINQTITIGNIDYYFDSDFSLFKSLSVGSFNKLTYTTEYFGSFNIETEIFYPNNDSESNDYGY